MNKINIRAIQDGITSEDFVKAKKCPYLLYDESYGAALWHKCFCGFAPKDRGMPQPCNLVWRGKCIQKYTPPKPQHDREPDWVCPRCGHRNAADNEVCMGAEMGDGRCRKPKPDKVKPLAQYLDEYIEREIGLGNKYR